MSVNNGELVPYWRSFVKASELVGSGRSQLAKRAAETAAEIERLQAERDELLAALKQIRNRYDDKSGHGSTFADGVAWERREVCKIIEAAITKAEGKS